MLVLVTLQTKHVQDRYIQLDRYLPGTVYDFYNVYSLGMGVGVRGLILVNCDKSLSLNSMSCH